MGGHREVLNLTNSQLCCYVRDTVLSNTDLLHDRERVNSVECFYDVMI
jgi:hypothetical protein